MRKYFSYILILIVLVGLSGPAERVQAASTEDLGTCYSERGLKGTILSNSVTQTKCFAIKSYGAGGLGGASWLKNITAGTGTWYYEYKVTSTGQNVIKGGFTEADCKSTSYPAGSTLVRACFQSSTPPVVTPPVTGTWYYEYKVTSTGQNVIRGPFTETECKSTPYPAGSTLVRACFQSSTPPVVTPPPQPPTPRDPNYILLAPLPCQRGDAGCVCDGPKCELKTFNPEQTNPLSAYLNLMIKLIIGLAAVMAVVMIVIGGLEYMTSELMHSKEHGKERITNAILGLLLALGAYTLLFTINPDLLNSEPKIPDAKVLVTLSDQFKAYSGSGKCEPVTDSSNPCSPEKLAAAGFPNGTQASSICNGESSGKPSLASQVDICSDGNSFSFGLFQINAIAHANELPGGVCSGVFQVNGGGTQGACLESKGSICIKRDCKVTNQTKFQSCVSYLTNPANNITYAKNLQAARNWWQWGANNSCRF